MKLIHRLKISHIPVFIYILIVITLTFWAAMRLYNGFPSSTSWTELFINYEGGFIRRGLLGQLLFMVDSIIDIQFFYTVLYVVLFFSFLFFSYKKLIQTFDSIIVALFFINPVIFLFPVIDSYVFGRKELWIEIVFFCITRHCVDSLTTNNKSNLYKNTLIIALLFLTGMLIHETTIFFFPIFAVLLGVAYARQGKIYHWVLVTGTLISIALFYCIAYSGTADMGESIFASWTQRYPEISTKGEINHIGVSFYEKIHKNYIVNMNLISLWSFLVGLCLCAFPFVLLWKAYHPYSAIRDLLAVTRILQLSFWLAVLAPCLLFIIGSDYGKYLSIASLCFIYFLYAIFFVCPQPAKQWLNNLKDTISVSQPLRLYISLVVIFSYGCSWRMLHYRSPEVSYIQPGVFFDIMNVMPHLIDKILSKLF